MANYAAYIKSKVTGATILLALVIVFVIQNTETVQVRLLLWNLSMPRSIMIFLVLLIGVAVGVLFRSAIMGYFGHKPK